ncbi:MAG: TonB-dependent receptor [Rhodospirillaceae bacterium]
MRRQHFGVAVSFIAAATSLIPISAYAAASAADTNTLHVDEIIITASPLGRDRFDVVQGTSVLTGDELAAALKPSIGETLASEPGVTSTFFGPYASRPVIRGFDGDRIRILFDGIGAIDASSVSPDHQTAGDALGAERIEVLRGPATLLYGSSAIGGVVNIIDGRIPTEVPANGYHGHLMGGYGSNADEKFVSGGTDVDVASGLMLHADAGWRKTGDYKIPGFASPEAQAEGIEGRVRNSDGRTTHGTGGASYVFENGVLGAAVERFTSNYGSPAEEAVRLDLKQTRVDFKGEMHDLEGFIASVRARGAYGDYQHQEIEGGAVGTTFTNQGWEGRIDAVHAPLGAITGTFGVQYRNRDFAAIGEEAFTPASKTRQFAGFLLESAAIGALKFEAGARVEGTRISLEDNTRRAFTSGAFSGSAAYEFAAQTLVGVTASWTQRAPTAEELFSEGPHLATNQFERGNPDLRQERATNLEMTFKHNAGPLTGSVALYRTWFDNYIFADQTGEAEDGLPVFAFSATKARFTGLESEVALSVLRDASYALSFDAGLDLVRATNAAANEPLPRTPPLRYRFGTDMRWTIVEARLEVVGAASQNRISPLETATKGYTFVNARLGVSPFADSDIQIVLQAQNLTGAAARPHTSFLKDVAPMPGRDVRLYVRASF